MTNVKTGAQALISTAVEAGIDLCFANPGTTEMPLVGALDTVPGIRPILCLHENVATGAADGYARMAGKPAMTLLHLGPGLGNGLTNLHNARRAHSPLVNVIGDHASWHLEADAPLNSPVEQIAGAVSGFVKKSDGADSLAADMAQAIAATRENGGQVATLIAPHDAQWSALKNTQSATLPPALPRTFAAQNVEAAIGALKTEKTALYLGGQALSELALRLLGRIAATTGADLICETFFARMERGGDLPAPLKLPYFPEEAIAMLGQYTRVISVGTLPPVAFFAYPDTPSGLTTADQDIVLARPDEDALGAIEALADIFDNLSEAAASPHELPNMPRGPLSPEAVCAVMANLQPEDAIVMDEGLTVSAPYHEASYAARRFTQLQLTGGAIGMGPGGATGAALACPDRLVINLQADGSGAYSVQALWTQARENLNVITVLLSNRSYHILNVELQRAGVTEPGPAAQKMASLDNPSIDWVSLAKGFGVPGIAVDTAEDFADALTVALQKKGPYLIEVKMP
jgi:acetolactate synthase I/II/III large subunit